MATIAVIPSTTLTDALAKVQAAIAALRPADQTDLKNALAWLEPVIEDELNAVAARYLDRLPVFGGMADDFVRAALARALNQGVADLTAAQAKVAS